MMICPKCGTPLEREFAVARCLICGERSEISNSYPNLWRQFRADAQCHALKASIASIDDNGRKHYKKTTGWNGSSLMRTKERMTRMPGNYMLEHIKIPEWFRDKLRKDRSDYWEVEDVEARIRPLSEDPNHKATV